MEIIDAQVHTNQISPTWATSDVGSAVDAAVSAMDAVGVDAVVVDDYAYVDELGFVHPGHVGPGGVWRYEYPFAEEAVRRYPARFAYVAKIEHDDPDLVSLVADVRAREGRLALRINAPGTEAAKADRVEQGVFTQLFEQADEHGVPIFIKLSARPEVLAPVLRKHPDLPFILDHTGVQFLPGGETTPDLGTRVQRVIDLAEFPNLAIKWSHIERLADERYPFADAMPHFRRLVDAYGAERVMWGSDHTESRSARLTERPCSWGEALHYLRDSDLFTDGEKEWMLGRSIRTLLRWPR